MGKLGCATSPTREGEPTGTEEEEEEEVEGGGGGEEEEAEEEGEEGNEEEEEEEEEEERVIMVVTITMMIPTNTASVSFLGSINGESWDAAAEKQENTAICKQGNNQCETSKVIRFPSGSDEIWFVSLQLFPKACY